MSFDDLSAVTAQATAAPSPSEDAYPPLAAGTTLTSVERATIDSTIEQLFACSRGGRARLTAALFSPRFIAGQFAGRTREEWEAAPDPTFPAFTLLDTSFQRLLADGRVIASAVVSYTDPSWGPVVTAFIMLLVREDGRFLIDEDLLGSEGFDSSPSYPDEAGVVAGLVGSPEEVGCFQPRVTYDELDDAWRRHAGTTPTEPAVPDLARPVSPETLDAARQLMDQWTRCSRYLDRLRMMSMYTESSWPILIRTPPEEWYRPGATWVYEEPYGYELVEVQYVSWTKDGLSSCRWLFRMPAPNRSSGWSSRW